MVCGVGVDWGVLFGGLGVRRVGLPTYAFQRERFWLDGGVRGGGDLSVVGQVSRIIRCWVLRLGCLGVGGCSLGVCLWVSVRGLVIMLCWVVCCWLVPRF